MIYLETSAKDKINIEESFTSLVVEMKKNVPKKITTTPGKLPVLVKSEKKKNTTCC